MNKKLQNTIPTEKDWGDWQSDLDTKYAHELFAGRSHEEMLPHFKRNVIERVDDLRWMLPIPFRYYMLGFCKYIAAEEFDSSWKSDAASCFLGLIKEKLENQPNDILPIMPTLLPVAEYVAKHQQKFNASQSIYGNFSDILLKIKKIYNNT